MICVCFWSQPAQHGWQISAAILCPNSFGKGANPIAGRFSPQCLQLIFPAIDNLLARDYSLPLRKFRVPGFELRGLDVVWEPESLNLELETRNSKLTSALPELLQSLRQPSFAG